MFKNKNKFITGLLCLAIFGFVFFSIGGEYLHEHIHDHENNQSQEHCLFYKLQIQVFTAFVAFGVLFCVQFRGYIFNVSQIFITKIHQTLPYLRGPPVLIFS